MGGRTPLTGAKLASCLAALLVILRRKVGLSALQAWEDRRVLVYTYFMHPSVIGQDVEALSRKA